jgi:hypothetical protein
MSHRRPLRQTIGVTLVLLLLVGCGGAATTPEPPADTAVPPTDTPPPIPEPQPGATVSGSIATGDKASSGMLSFKVSETGDAITDLSISLEKANCNGMITMGSVMDYLGDPGIAIADGAFEGPLPAMGGMVTDYNFNPPDPFPSPVPDPYTVGQITGRFTSPTTASGTITIFLGAAMSGGVVCELGTFDWSSP